MILFCQRMPGLWATLVLAAVAATPATLGQDAKTGVSKKDAAAPPSRTASCMVRIESDPLTLPIDPPLVEALLNSSPVKAAAVHEVLGISNENEVQMAFEAYSPGSPMIGRLLVEIVAAEELNVRPAANELIVAICRNLEHALSKAHNAGADGASRRLERLHARLRNAQVQVGEMRALRDEMLKAAGQPELSRGELVARIRDLESARHSLKLDLAGETAARAALEAQIGEIARKVQEAAARDEVIAELQKVAELRGAELGQVEKLRQQGQASEADVLKAREQIATARAELARQKQAAVQAAGGEILASLNSQLLGLSVKAAEAQARLKALDEALAEADSKNLLALADKYETEIMPSLQAALDAMGPIRNEIIDVESELADMRPPSLTILGGP